MINIPLWVFIVLLATNVVIWFIALIIAEIVCYIHDIIQLELWYRKVKGKTKKERK